MYHETDKLGYSGGHCKKLLGTKKITVTFPPQFLTVETVISFRSTILFLSGQNLLAFFILMLVVREESNRAQVNLQKCWDDLNDGQCGVSERKKKKPMFTSHKYKKGPS